MHPTDDDIDDTTTQELHIHGLGFQGEGYHALEDHQFISIPHTLPDEVVEVRVGPMSRRRAWGHVLRLLRSSPDRVDPQCPHYATCSGCALRHVSLEYEIQWKKESVLEILERYGPSLSTLPPLDVLCANTRQGHRIRGAFSVELRDGDVRLGLRSTTLDRPIVDIRDCPAQHPRFLSALQHVGALLDDNLSLAEIISAVSIELGADNQLRIIWRIHRSPSPDERALLGQPILSTTPAIRLLDGSFEALDPSAPLSLPLPHGPHAHPKNWFHPNPAAAKLLMDWVASHMPPAETLLDICCGLGTATMTLAPNYTRVIAIDTDHHAVRALTEAAAVRGLPHVEGRSGKAGTVLRKLLQKSTRAACALINPMRSPLGPKTLQYLRPLGVQSLIYLGPSPVSAVKDLKVLVSEGFSLARMALVNLHPGTAQTMFAFLLHRSRPNAHTPPVDPQTTPSLIQDIDA